MTAAPKHTKIGPGLFSWAPYLNLRRTSADAAHLWQVLYMSAQAKLGMPGLWLGGHGAMADAAYMTFDETVKALDVIVAHGMAEYDDRAKVCRLTMLPDKCEAASSPNALRALWTKYQTVPECGVKQRYLELLVWLQLPFQSSKRSEKEGMRLVWDETFGALLASPPLNASAVQAPISRVSSTPQKQLDLLSGLTESVHVPPSVPDRSGEGKGSGKAEGESERGCPQPASASPPIAPEPPAYVPPDYLHAAQPLEPGEVVVLAGAQTSDEPPDVVEAHSLWEVARERVRRRMTPGTFGMFIDPLVPLARHGPVLHLQAPSKLIAECVRSRHQRELESELHAITGHAMQIAI